MGGDCEARGGGEEEGEGDVVAGDEAAAVGEEEEEGDFGGALGWWDGGFGSVIVGAGFNIVGCR